MQRKYPWEEWFGSKITVLVRGEDYDCSQSTMVQLVRNRATLEGIKVKIIDTDTEIIIVVLGRRDEGAISRPNKAPVTR